MLTTLVSCYKNISTETWSGEPYRIDDMSTEPLDIYEYRAALLEWHQENVGQAQLIFVAEDWVILYKGA